MAAELHKFPRSTVDTSELLALGDEYSATVLFNPLTTNDDYSRHRNLAACYQLAQSILKIGSARAERVGRGRWVGAPLWLTVHGSCCSWL